MVVHACKTERMKTSGEAAGDDIVASKHKYMQKYGILHYPVKNATQMDIKY